MRMSLSIWERYAIPLVTTTRARPAKRPCGPITWSIRVDQKSEATEHVHACQKDVEQRGYRLLRVRRRAMSDLRAHIQLWPRRFWPSVRLITKAQGVNLTD